MSKIITNDYGDTYKTPGFWRTAGAVAVGSTVMSGVVLGSTIPLNKYLVNKTQGLSNSVDSTFLWNEVKDAFKTSKLAEKGVKFWSVNENTKIRTIYDFLPKKLRNLLIPIEAIKAGRNAAYSPDIKRILINKEKFGLSAFHEMGHAFNHNFCKFWHVVQKSRTPLRSAAGLMASVALFKRPKAEGEQPKNGFDRATTFIKNNVGKLVTLCFVPIVAEELKATQRGNKMAAKVLPKEMLAKVKKVNKLGAATYVTTALMAGFGAFVATKVRDAIAHPKEV